MASLRTVEANHSLAGSNAVLTNASTSTGLLHLPPTFLDAIVPGYSVLASSLLSSFGIDLSYYVSLVALLFAATTAFQVTLKPIFHHFNAFISSSVVVDEYDTIFDHIQSWVQSQKSMQNHRILRAHTGNHYDDNDDAETEAENSQLSSDIIFNFRDFATRAFAKYQPHSTTGFFMHKGYIFQISRAADRVQTEWSDTVREREKFTITVLARTTAPIKDLIEEARELSLSKRTSRTMILRPTPKQQRGHGNEWQAVSTRPSRSLDTVVLDDEQKTRCVSDINEFLKAATWYSNRGIPYRRGYLFWGAPGTGKTSLSFALAGLFGLEIYCLSLSEATLTEDDLIMLFTALPQRCIVLLEDIDCAGVSRPRPEGDKAQDESKEKEKKDKKKKKKKSSPSTDVAEPPNQLANAITISGLLNAIDGVATAEGRVLIMTTNYPQKLDAALTRPGRIDLRIEFRLSSKQQIKELFLRMYGLDEKEGTRQPTKLSQITAKRSRPSNGVTESLASEATAAASIKGKLSGLVTPGSESCESKGLLTPSGSSTPSEKDVRDEDDLEHLATLFAAALPEETFSPAEIQGFLLMHKKGPLQAVQNVGSWRDEELLKKRTKKANPEAEQSKKNPATVEEESSEKVETAKMEVAKGEAEKETAVSKKKEDSKKKTPDTEKEESSKQGKKRRKNARSSDESASGSRGDSSSESEDSSSDSD
jgi:chaperone BCS1